MRRTILVVDDVELNRELLQNMLKAEYDVLEADNGKAALEVLEREHERIAAVLLDIVMPIMDGYEVLAHMRQDARYTAIPVIVTTGATDYGDEIKALAAGANDYITKPYNPPVITHRLHNTIKFRETAAIANLAVKDDLTGLYNRSGFFKKAAELISEQPPGYYVIGCFDINGFKVINDQYGNETGDRVLRHVAAIMTETFLECGGICARIMADHFASLFPISLVSTDVLEDFAHRVTVQSGSLPSITFSAGHCVVTDASLSASALYDRASLAKDSIKGRMDVNTAIYDESMRTSILLEQEIIREMGEALVNHDFEVWYQPQYNHVTQTLVGSEALVRWRHPEKGLISPAVFIPIFERNGFVFELDKYVWESVCQTLSTKLTNKQSPLPVSVNVSRYDTLKDELIDVIIGLVRQYDIPVDLLRIEITESAFTGSNKEVISVVQQLVDYGFTVEIDDFGSGYSSLNTLKDVPAQVLKLDMRFLEGDSASSRGGNILESIVRMAKWIGMSVIAEGVEHASQADYLASVGCSYIQGYLYAKPMTLAEFNMLELTAEISERSPALETVKNMDNNDFWDPSSMDTLIFNSYVGGACVFEFTHNNIELVRASKRYIELLGSTSMTVEDALKLNWLEHLDTENLNEVQRAFDESIKTGNEVLCEYALNHLPGCDETIYLRTSMRVIARAGERYLIYCANQNITAQKLAEQREHTTSTQLSAIMSGMNGGVAVVSIDSNGGVHQVFTNENYYTLFGYTREQFEAEEKGMLDFIHPDDRKQAIEDSVLVLKEHSTKTFNYRGLRRDGSVIYIKFNASVVCISGLENNALLSVITDITEVVELSTQLSAIMSNISGGITAITIDENANVSFIFANEAYYSMLGYTKEQYNAEVKSPFDLVHPDDRDKVRSDTLDNSTVQGSFSCLYRAICRDKSVRWIQSNITVVQMANSSLPVQISVANDITAEHEAVQKSVEALERLQVIMDNVSCGITASCFTGDYSARILFANDRYYSMLGYTREEYENEFPHGYGPIHPDDREYVLQAAPGAVNSDSPISLEFRLLKKDDSIVWVRQSITSTDRLVAGNTIQLSIVTDITAEKNAAQQLDFLNDTAHLLLAQADIPTAISIVLNNVLEYFAGDRVFVAEYDYNKGTCMNTYESFIPSCKPNPLLNVPTPISYAEQWLKTFETSNFYDVEDVTSSGTPTLDTLLSSSLSVHRILAVSLRLNGIVIGTLGVFNPTRRMKDYDNLAALGDYMAVILTRRDLNAKINSDRQTLLNLMNDTPGGFAKFRLLEGGELKTEYVNDVFCSMINLPRERLLSPSSTNIMNVIHPDDITEVRAVIKEMVETGEKRFIRYRLRLSNGDYIWQVVYGRVTRDPNGDMFINAYYADPTIQEQKELSLRQAVPFVLNAIMDSSEDLAFAKDKNFKYICCTNAFLRHAGCSTQSDIIGKSDYELFDKKTADKFRAEDEELFSTGKPMIDSVAPLSSSDGELRYSNTSKFILRDSAGNIIGLYGVGRDITEYRHAFERLRLLTDNVSGGLAMYEISADAIKLTYVSEGFFSFTGYTREQYVRLAANNVFASIYPEDIQKVSDAFSSVLADNVNTCSCTYRMYNKKGELRWLSLKGTVLERREGSVVLNTLKLDITEQKLAEEALRIHDEELKVALSQMSKMVFLFDVATLSITIPEAYAEQHGISGVKVADVPRCFKDYGLSSGADYDAICDFYARILAGESHCVAEAHVSCIDGYNPLERAEAITIFDDEGEPVKAIIFVEDVTDRHSKDEANEILARICEGYYAMYLMDTVKETVTPLKLAKEMSMISQGKQVDWSSNVERVLTDAISDTDLPEVYALLEIDTVKHGFSFFSDQKEIVYKQKGDAWKRLIIQPLAMSNGETEKALVTIIDVTEIYVEEQRKKNALQKAVDDANEANRAKSEFLSRMSHDIRTPMNAVIGLLDLARDEDNPPKTIEYLSNIESSSRFLLGLINDILDLSKIESGKIELHAEPFFKADFIKNINTVMQPLFSAKNITFNFLFGEENEVIVVDKLRFTQIFYNLLSNAAKYTQSGGHVDFILKKLGNKDGKEGYEFTVSDNGKGMSEEFLTVLFEPFSQERHEHDSEIQGSGLGLAIVKNLVDTMGGEIKVTSTLGRGTTFVITLYFDVTQTVHHNENEAHIDLSCLNGLRVLLVDDNEMNIIVAKNILQRKGCIVETATNGLIAVRAFEASATGHYSIILMDIRMPVMGGLEAARTIRKLNRVDALTVPIIPLTADAFSEDMDLTREAGMNGHLSKPIEPEELYNTIARWSIKR